MYPMYITYIFKQSACAHICVCCVHIYIYTYVWNTCKKYITSMRRLVVDYSIEHESVMQYYGIIHISPLERRGCLALELIYNWKQAQDDEDCNNVLFMYFADFIVEKHNIHIPYTLFTSKVYVHIYAYVLYMCTYTHMYGIHVQHSEGTCVVWWQTTPTSR